MERISRNILLLIFLSISSAFPQNKFNFEQFGDETSQFISQPIKWNIGDYGKLGILALSTFLVMNIDDDIRDEILKDQNHYNSIPIEAGRIWGEPYSTVIISSLLALSGVINDNTANKKTAYEVIQSGLYTGTVTQLLKISIGRARPYMNSDTFNFYPLQKFDNDYWSLPSGHTSLAFSLSTILSQNSKTDLMKIAWYIPAVMTAFSRIYQDQHWTSDVILGSAVGYFIAKWVTNLHNENEKYLVNNPTPLISLQIKL